MSAGAVLDEEVTRVLGAAGTLVGMAVRKKIERAAFAAAVEALAKAVERLRGLL